MEQVFKSKLGLEVTLPIVIILVLDTYLTLSSVWWPSTLVVIGIWAFMIYLYFETKYTITADQKLLIKCGFLVSESIEIAKISRISSTRTWVAAPAFSLDRLRIFIGENATAVISPDDKKRFLSALKDCNPAIEIDL